VKARCALGIWAEPRAALSSAMAPPLDPTIDLVIRRARAADLPEIARLLRLWIDAAWDFLVKHTPEEDLHHVEKSSRLGPIWLAVEAGRIVGFCTARRGWIDHLFVAPDRHGRGIGGALLARALAGRSRVRLWTFQRNTRTRRFYALQGFREVLTTDGRDNEEREPDVLLEWRRS